MHELPISESILEIALRHADKAHAKRITDIHLVIGQLSSIVDESISFYWDIISQGTIAEGANLHFRRIQTKLLCLDCNQYYNPGKDDLACPSCHSSKVKVVAGEEFSLEAIEVEA
ncbi:MAG: hydrogenase maturation nickel metallochaperone HypA [Chloroflexi bacterium RBG_16_48_8]|nr:MAG: hydrogenase maturation nickel metallochaperone HypA [Chloroflexi bacterium RBG_16_48_8]